MDHNKARGGDGGAGGNGGNGSAAACTTTPPRPSRSPASTVQHNFAVGGSGGCGGSDGQGIGGGVYIPRAPSAFDSTTVIKKNHASTSNDNIGP